MVVVRITNICTSSSRCLARDRHSKEGRHAPYFAVTLPLCGWAFCSGTFQLLPYVLVCMWLHVSFSAILNKNLWRKPMCTSLHRKQYLQHSPGPCPVACPCSEACPRMAVPEHVGCTWRSLLANRLQQWWGIPFRTRSQKPEQRLSLEHAGGSPVQRPMWQEPVSSAGSHQGPEAYRSDHLQPPPRPPATPLGGGRDQCFSDCL